MPILGATEEESVAWANAPDEEIPGAWKDLARQARQITGKVASRVAARRAGISHDTIIRLWDGDRISVQKLLDFAQGYGINPKPLLEAARYPILESTSGIPLADSERVARPLRDAGRETALEIERIPLVDDALEIAHLYSGIADPRMRTWVKKIMREAIEITDKEPEDAGPSGDGTD